MNTTPPSATPSESPADAAPAAPIDTVAIEALIAKKRARQSLPLAVIAGAIAALIGAVIWAMVTVATAYQIGWMAVGVGFLVGLAVRTGGKGIDPIFGYLGAILALLGCLLGNLFSALGFFAQARSVSFLDVLGMLDLDLAVPLLKIDFSPMDLLFHGIAGYEGYRFSFTSLPPANLPSSQG